MCSLPLVAFSLQLRAKAVEDGTVLVVPAETSGPEVLTGVH